MFEGKNANLNITQPTTPTNSRVALVDSGNDTPGPVKVQRENDDAEILIKKAREDLQKTRAEMNKVLGGLLRTEAAIEQLVREQVDLPAEIQITAAVNIPPRSIIMANKNALDCVLMGMAKGQIVQDGPRFKLLIHERVKLVPPEKGQ